MTIVKFKKESKGELNIFQQVKEKIDLLEFVQNELKMELRPAGQGRHQGLCPIHADDKTPSFTVYDNQSWYCFGCQKGGDAIDLVAEYYNYSHYDAARHLAEKIGIEIASEDLTRLNTRLAKQKKLAKRRDHCYNRLLETKKARKYLAGRGITLEMADAFDLGYSQTQDAIVIPLYDKFGKIVGFTRRFLDPDKTPKYLNSVSDDLFDKSGILYNVHLARRFVRDKLYICEGQFDAMSLYALGEKSVVGMGTNRLSERQIEIITEIIKHETMIVFVMDPPKIKTPENEKESKKLRDKLQWIRKNYASLRSVISNPIGVVDLKGQDMNDWYADGNALEDLPRIKSAAQYMVEMVLVLEEERERQYVHVKEILADVKNPLVVEDVIDFLSQRWSKSRESLKQFLITQETSSIDLSLIRTLPEIAKSYGEYVADDMGKISCGYPVLDGFTKGGLRKGQTMWIVAGTGAAKTAMAMNLLRKICQNEIPSIYFSLELEDTQVFERAASMSAKMDSDDIEYIFKSRSEKAVDITKKIGTTFKQLVVVDQGGLTLRQLEEYIRQAGMFKIGQPVRLAVVDYFGYLNLKQGRQSEYEALSDGAKQIKEIAKRLDISIVVLSQTSREHPAGEPLSLESARGSGVIEESADFLIGLYRPSLKDGLKEEEQIAVEKELKGQVLKSRSGKWGTFDMTFDIETQLIEEADTTPVVFGIRLKGEKIS